MPLKTAPLSGSSYAKALRQLRHLFKSMPSGKSSTPSNLPSNSGGNFPKARYLSKYFLIKRSIPPGNEGKIPRGRWIPLTCSSQKHLGHSKNTLSVEGDN